MKQIDPLINQPEPITLLFPVIESTLLKAKIRTNRDEILKRFNKSRPRIAIVSGSDDHPAHVYDDVVIEELVKQIWQQNGIPFILKVPTMCDGIAQGHAGMEYSLKSRDFTTELVMGQIVGHHYHGVIFISGCDKNPAGFLGAAIKVNQVYQKVYNKPFPFLVINTPVMRDIKLPESIKRILPKSPELKDLFSQTLKCNVYAQYYKILSDLQTKGRIKNKEKILKELSKYVCTTGGTCAFMGTGNSSKFILYGLGIVPDELALPVIKDYTDGKRLKKVVQLLFQLNREKIDCIKIIEGNLLNSHKILGAVNGSLNWILHFKYLANLLKKKINLPAAANNIPVLYPADKSVFQLAEVKEIFSMMKYLLNKKIIKNQSTLQGDWHVRLKRIRDKQYTVLDRSRFLSFSGNLFKRVYIKLNQEEYQRLKLFHNQYLICLVFHSQDEFLNTLLKEKKNIKQQVEKIKLKHKLNSNLIAIFILKEGLEAKGMPEMYYPSEYINKDDYLKDRTLLITDGRFSGATYGFSFGYMEPEYKRSKALQKLKTGDLIQFDFVKRKINLARFTRGEPRMNMNK